jgi:hypothetical protein
MNGTPVASFQIVAVSLIEEAFINFFAYNCKNTLALNAQPKNKNENIFFKILS